MALTQIVTTDSVSASVVNTKIVDPANTALAGLQIAQTAGGTATAITLTGVELTNGYQKTFIISASNSGSATTVNGKPLYKPGGTVAPNLVSGKSASIWYSLAGDCFFYKASAEGTATAGDVLAGKTFSNDDDTALIGTLSLTGDALVSDVVTGKTFYNTDAKTKLTGTYSNIKSIQRGISTAWTAVGTEFSITISSIDASKAIATVSLNDYTTAAFFATMVEIVDSTTIKISRITSSDLTPPANIYWEVIEFENVKSKQSGTKAITSNSETTQAISTVDMGKSILFCSFKGNEWIAYNKITSATLLTFQYTSGSYIHWQVIEFN